MQIAPSEAESKSLTAWLKQPGHVFGELAEPEQYLTVISGIPSFKSKVSVLIFRQQYPEIVSDATAALKVINTACQQVRAGPVARSCIRPAFQIGAKVIQELCQARSMAKCALHDHELTVPC